MKYLKLTQLKQGHKVYWNDPDNEDCSQVLDIHTIQYKENNEVAFISTVLGNEIECFVSELELVCVTCEYLVEELDVNGECQSCALGF